MRRPSKEAWIFKLRSCFVISNHALAAEDGGTTQTVNVCSFCGSLLMTLVSFKLEASMFVASFVSLSDAADFMME